MHKVRLLLFTILLAATGIAQQNANGNGQAIPLDATSLAMQLSNPPTQVTGVSVQLFGNPGPATYYFWIVADFPIGNSTPAGPFVLQNGPNAFSSSNYGILTWMPAAGATSYDILLTPTSAAPAGNCNCALATGITAISYHAITNTTIPYTITTFDPNTCTVNEVNIPRNDITGTNKLKYFLPNGNELGFLDSFGNWSTNSLTARPTTVSNLTDRTSGGIGTLADVSDGSGPTDCSVGGGSNLVLCQYQGGGVWRALISSSGGGNITGGGTALNYAGFASASSIQNAPATYTGLITTFQGQINTPAVDTEVYAADYSGADMCAKIIAATGAAACSGSGGNLCRVHVPAGKYPCTSPMTLPSNVWIQGNGEGSTELDWTPTTGTMLTISGTNGVKVSDIMLRNNVASSTAEAVRLGGSSSAFTSDTVLEDLQVGGDNDSNGFATNVEIGGTASFAVLHTVMKNVASRAYTGSNGGVFLHHSVDFSSSIVTNYAIQGGPCNPTAAPGLVIDTGTSGVQSFMWENGCAGTIIRNSMPTNSTYGYPPQYIFFNQRLDDLSPANGVLYDASLNTPSGSGNNFVGYDYECVNCWEAGSTLAGLRADGGMNIRQTNTYYRDNGHEGALLTGLTQDPCSGIGSDGLACGGFVSLLHSTFNDNNTANGGYSDVNVAAGVSHVKLENDWFFGTGGGDCCSGSVWAITVASGSGDDINIANNTSLKQMGGFLQDYATGIHQSIENNWSSDSSSDFANVLFPSGSMGLSTATYESGGTISGSTGNTCAVSTFNGGNSGATGTVTLTGTNTIAAGTPILITNTGSGSYVPASSATLSNGTGATCSGTITIVSSLGGAAGTSIRNHFGIGANQFYLGFDSAGLASISPAPSAEISFDPQANSFTGQWNTSVNGSQIFLVRDSTHISQFNYDMGVIGNFHLASLSNGCLNVTAGIVGSTGTSCGTPLSLTQNLLAKSNSAGTGLLNSTVLDDGTDPTQTPNGINTVNGGYQDQNTNSSSPGTIQYYAVCLNSSAQAYRCNTTDTSGIIGIAKSGAGTTGSALVCKLDDCPATFDNTATPGHTAILSTTTGGQLHDTGSVSPPTNGQQWLYIKTANSGGGTNASVDVLNALIVSGGANGVRGTFVQFNGTLSGPVGNINGSSPAPDTNYIANTVKTSTSGTTTSAIVETPYGTNSAKGALQCDGTTTTCTNGIVSSAAGGLTNIVGPTNLIQWAIGGGTATGTLYQQMAGWVLQGESVSSPVPQVIQGSPSNTPCIGLGTVTCTFAGGVSTTSVLVMLAVNWTGGSSVTWSDGHSDAVTVICTTCDGGNGANAYAALIATPTGGATTITFTNSTQPSAPTVLFIYEVANVNQTHPQDTSVTYAQGGSCTPVCALATPSITTVTNNAMVMMFIGAANSSSVTFSTADGWTPSLLQNTESGSGGVSGAAVWLSGQVAGTFNAPMFATAGSGYSTQAVAIALRPATSGAGATGFGPITWPMLTQVGIPGAYNYPPSVTNGDTGIDVHVGTPLNIASTTTNYTSSPWTLYTAPSSPYPTSLHCWVDFQCRSASGSDTAIPLLVYKDEDGNTVTLTGATASCPSGSPHVSNNAWPITLQENQSVFLEGNVSGATIRIHAVCEVAASSP